jgi:hypothetical protein
MTGMMEVGGFTVCDEDFIGRGGDKKFLKSSPSFKKTAFQGAFFGEGE